MALRPAQPLYRAALKALHWISFVLVIAVMIAGITPVTQYGLAFPVIVWIVGFAIYGVLATPGPVLTGVLRTAFVPMHAGLYVLLSLTAAAVLRADAGAVTGSARVLCLATLGAGALHGVFHLWRHTALGDGALRNITPKAFHGVL